MISPKASPPTLSRERGEEPLTALFVQDILVARQPWETKWQCIGCECTDVTDPRNALCPACLAYNPTPPH